MLANAPPWDGKRGLGNGIDRGVNEWCRPFIRIDCQSPEPGNFTLGDDDISMSWVTLFISQYDPNSPM